MSLADYFKSILHYDESSGKLFWKYRSNMPSRWNTRYVGKEAGRRNNGYIMLKIDNQEYYAHRVIWCMKIGSMPEKFIDHVNMDRDDNRFDNLREATSSTNMMNMRAPSDNTSGFKGVNFNHMRQKWMARIAVNGMRKHLGYFDCKAAAHFAYVVAADKWHKEFARVL